MAMKAIRQLLLVTMLAVQAPAAWAIDPASVPPQKQTRLGLYVTAEEAAGMMATGSKDILFLDIRSSAEAVFVGMASPVDANVPYMNMPDFPVWDDARNTLKLEPNPDFLAEVEKRLARKGLDRTSPIILMCRSGDRSAAGTNLLEQAGYTKVYSVVDGFEGDLAKEGPKAGQRVVNGWKNAGLPWSYKLDKTKMHNLE
jgi:rhodanese-related sulfurtransferase